MCDHKAGRRPRKEVQITISDKLYYVTLRMYKLIILL